MDDLRKRMDSQDHIITGIRGDTQIQAGAIQGIQNKFNGMDGKVEGIARDVALILNALGEEKEDGQGQYLGTGLLGRVRRVERAQRSLRELYHRWIAFGAGFSGCLGGAVVIIWWLLGDKLAIVLKGTGHG